jgi:hypothetical protein
MKVGKEVAMLLVREGESPQRQWLLQDDTTVLGRGADCDVIIDDRKASRHHARIFFTAEGYMLEDLGSKNGTFLNGSTLKEAALLHDGDEIGIAFAAKLAFVDVGATAPLVFDGTAEASLEIDLGAKRVWVAGTELSPPLSLSQFRLLELLHRHAGEVVSREDVVQYVWADEAAEGVSEQAIDALARRLRERISEADPDHQYIITVRGHGYRLQYAEEQ